VGFHVRAAAAVHLGVERAVAGLVTLKATEAAIGGFEGHHILMECGAVRCGPELAVPDTFVTVNPL
jgi:hypothetical protein